MGQKAKIKQLRKEFNKVCKERDDNICVLCVHYLGKPAAQELMNRPGISLEVHHITNRKQMPNGGYAPENGITLCNICHAMVEHHPDWEDCDKELLYNLIGSSYGHAFAKSVELD